MTRSWEPRYLGSVGRSVLTVDRTRMRHWSALRRGLAVMLTLAVVTVATDAETGALASIAGLYVALQDRSGPVNYTARVMVAESVLLAAVITVAGYFSATRMIPWALLVVAAFLAGITAVHDKALSRMLGDVMPVAAFLGLSTMEHKQAWVSGLAVLFGGLVQAALARAWVSVEGDLPERRVVAAALVAVADHLDDALVRASTKTGKAAEDRLTEARDMLDRSDLSHERRRALRRLVADAEVLRQEAAGIRLRKAINVAVIRDPEVVTALAVASRALRQTAQALTCVGVPGRFDARAEAAIAGLYPCRLAAEEIANDTTARPTARSLANQTLHVYGHVAQLEEVRGSRDQKRSHPVGENLASYLTHPTPVDLRNGARLAIATVIALAVALFLHVPHGAWVAATTVALLRPDYRALTSDTVARAAGTALGAVATLPLVWLGHGIGIVELLMAGVLATIACAIVSVNEGLFVVAMTVQTVFTRAVVGEDPMAAARLRMVDVLLGCVIAVILLVIMPIGHGRKLSADMSAYALSTADWVEAVTEIARGKHPQHLTRLRRSMRDARVQVQHGLDLRVIEPLGPGLSAERGLIVFTRVHDCARAVAAAERSLKHGDPTGSASVAMAEDVAATLRVVGEALATHELPEEFTGFVEAQMTEGDDIGELLAFAVSEAHAAQEAITVQRPDQSRHY